ncbi:MAG: hypothetical protein AB2637_02300, partial [Candidatus Thiodiazotropha sp.]
MAVDPFNGMRMQAVRRDNFRSAWYSCPDKAMEYRISRFLFCLGEYLFGFYHHVSYVSDGCLNGKVFDSIDLTSLEFGFETTAVSDQPLFRIDFPTVIAIKLAHRKSPFLNNTS